MASRQLVSASPFTTEQGIPDTGEFDGWGREDLLFEESPDASQHSFVHHRRQPARLRILLARMVNAKHPWRIARQLRLGTVSEHERRTRCNQAALLQNFQICIPSDF